MSKIFVIHENSEWLPPFAVALDAEGVPWEEWYLVEGALDLDAVPPEGVFYSRMSASSHTRGHVASKDYTRSVLSWLESHGRLVVNGRRVVELEMSKVDQHTALRAFGFDVPSTVAVIGRHDLKVRARGMTLPFITKHNQGGKGLGVRRFDSLADFDDYVDGYDYEHPVDGITLLQEYLDPVGGHITRVEIVGGEFLYALTADTRAGFQLCPADECDDTSAGLGLCPADVQTAGSLFHWREGFRDPIIDRYLEFSRFWGIGIAGFEFIETEDGRLVTYDINTNTNYNPVVEEEAGRSGPVAVARYLAALARELETDRIVNPSV
ncbi:MAG: hypothetical protein OSA36_09875 [Acidimicrobiales bacterium]|nr:hypothetical protein [Acidimicrobiales bacterium]